MFDIFIKCGYNIFNRIAGRWLQLTQPGEDLQQNYKEIAVYFAESRTAISYFSDSEFRLSLTQKSAES